MQAKASKGDGMMKKPRELLWILVIVAACGLNYPWLNIVSMPLLIFGIPVLYFYLFGLWLVFIFLVCLLVRHLDQNQGLDGQTQNDHAE